MILPALALYQVMQEHSLDPDAALRLLEPVFLKAFSDQSTTGWVKSTSSGTTHSQPGIQLIVSDNPAGQAAWKTIVMEIDDERERLALSDQLIP